MDIIKSKMGRSFQDLYFYVEAVDPEPKSPAKVGLMLLLIKSHSSIKKSLLRALRYSLNSLIKSKEF